MASTEGPNEYDYFKRKKTNRTYISKRFTNEEIGENTRYARIVSKVIDSAEFWTHAKLKDEITLRVTPGGRQEIVAKIYEVDRGILVLSIQRYTLKNGNPHKDSFSFIGEEIINIKEFIDSLKYHDFSDTQKTRVEDDELQKVRTILKNSPDPELLIEMAQKNITKRDVVTLAFRKEQLKIFNELLSSEHFFAQKKVDWSKKRDEDVWQNFFEYNPWIFGYGLNLVFNEPLQGRKLEQVVNGFDVVNSGKRIDGLLKSRGIVNSLCLIEVKTHKTKLLKQVASSYRSDCWQLSDELNGGIAQVQKTSQKTIESIGTKLEPQKKDGTPTGENIYLYQPKSYLVIGKLSEFKTEQGLNKEKYSSFELFRRNLVSPEIITFDELHERAKFIVHNNEIMSSKNQ